VDGIRAAADFTQVPWVKKQFLAKLSIDAYPGTVNLEIAEEDLQTFETLKAREGIEITPEQATFCNAKCYPVLISGQVKGAIVFPLVQDYPKNKMELIAPVNVRETLSLKAGDMVEVEVLRLEP
jgi:CTP-dependent riboflavin kinase